MPEDKKDIAFAGKIFRALAWGFLSVLLSLGIGVFGFCLIENIPLIDAFHESSMIYSGMGPVLSMKSSAGKIFAGLYALFSAFALLVPITLIIGPIFHRFLHRFHLDQEETDGL